MTKSPRVEGPLSNKRHGTRTRTRTHTRSRSHRSR
jgi:hypothetical protein